MDDRQDFSSADKKRMLLSAETRLGLRMTGMSLHYWYLVIVHSSKSHANNHFVYFFYSAMSFVGLVRYLFSLPEVKNQLAFLSQHVCQDPLENFFGCQRQRGGTSDNPSVQEYYRNTQALRVMNSFCRGPVKRKLPGAKVPKIFAMKIHLCTHM